MKAQTCIVQLGRYGDIINILPIVEHIGQEDGKPVLLMASRYVDIGQGISYAESIPWNGDWDKIHEALGWAKQNYHKVIVPQAWAQNYEIPRQCESFALEQWRLAGYLCHWSRLRLSFDNRNAERESRLCESLGIDGRKLILFNGTGYSSPYELSGPLFAGLSERFGGTHRVIDLAKVRAERLFDLLALFDRAQALVTIDTATLHLAYASSVPTVALIADKPGLWNGTRVRENVVLSMRYAESKERLDDIYDTVCALDRPSQPKLIHVYSGWKPNDSGQRRRYDLAYRTWMAQYAKGNWKSMPVFDHMLPTTFQCEKRTLPYIKDLCRIGCSLASDQDVIVLTNSDVCMCPNAGDQILSKVASCGCAFAHRRDFGMLGRPLSHDEIAKGRHYEGNDLFAFSKAWWSEHGEKLPSLLLATEYWDQCLRELMKRTCRCEDAELRNLIYHEFHATAWSENRYTLPSQKHNRTLAFRFLKRLGVPESEISK